MRLLVLELLTIAIVALIMGAVLAHFIDDEFWAVLITLLVALLAGRLVNPAAYKPQKKDN